jgi:hypothetical protein
LLISQVGNQKTQQPTKEKKKTNEKKKKKKESGQRILTPSRWQKG